MLLLRSAYLAVPPFRLPSHPSPRLELRHPALRLCVALLSVRATDPELVLWLHNVAACVIDLLWVWLMGVNSSRIFPPVWADKIQFVNFWNWKPAPRPKLTPWRNRSCLWWSFEHDFIQILSFEVRGVQVVPSAEVLSQRLLLLIRHEELFDFWKQGVKVAAR